MDNFLPFEMDGFLTETTSFIGPKFVVLVILATWLECEIFGFTGF